MLRALTGVELSRGAVTQDVLRSAKGCGGRCVPEAAGVGACDAVVHTDDTGWRVAVRVPL